MDNKKNISCLDTKEFAKDYNAYLQTRHWRQLREVVAERSNHRCKKCAKEVKKGFCVHHLTYDRLGHERLGDLCFLCEDCHNLIHKIAARKKAKKAKCPYCKTVLEKRGMYHYCTKCNYYTRPFVKDFKPEPTYRKQMENSIREQKLAYDKLVEANNSHRC